MSQVHSFPLSGLGNWSAWGASRKLPPPWWGTISWRLRGNVPSTADGCHYHVRLLYLIQGPLTIPRSHSTPTAINFKPWFKTAIPTLTSSLIHWKQASKKQTNKTQTTALLRYNFRNIKSAPLKHASKWFQQIHTVVECHHCLTERALPFHRGVPCPATTSSPLTSSLSAMKTVNLFYLVFQSRIIRLFWTFHVRGIIWHTVFHVAWSPHFKIQEQCVRVCFPHVLASSSHDTVNLQGISAGWLG